MFLRVLCAFALWPGLVWCEPSRGFTQELAHAAQAGRVYLDLFNSTGVTTVDAPSMIRVGTAPGEFMVGMDELGLKKMVYRNIAVYGLTALSTARSHLNLRVGAAIDWRPPFVLLNVNPELTRTDGVNSIVLNGALLLPLETGGSAGKFQFQLESTLLDSRLSHAALAAGLRWLPDPALTIDIILIGDSGQAGRAIDAATPTALRINWRLM